MAFGIPNTLQNQARQVASGIPNTRLLVPGPASMWTAVACGAMILLFITVCTVYGWRDAARRRDSPPGDSNAGGIEMQ
ncbi:hypothetical protein VTL71DRAFT_12969 [Oculimacula yallundae]|uniref:Uncharacterized protein n=1 Tax=Oculimacula yallundae TaxID=86028 RepID=A0ABR4CRN2_9HELO